MTAFCTSTSTQCSIVDCHRVLRKKQTGSRQSGRRWARQFTRHHGQRRTATRTADPPDGHARCWQAQSRQHGTALTNTPVGVLPTGTPI